MTLTFLGNGAMAKAMIHGLLNTYTIEVVGRDQDKLDALNKEFQGKLTTHTYDKGFNITGKHLILCVKPYALEQVALHVEGQALSLISVLAGTSLDLLQKFIKAKHTVRAMPNLAAAFGKSMTTLTGDVAFQKESETILKAIGQTLWLNSEKELDIATGLAGSGPAFLALIAEALADGAVREGLKRDDAYILTRGLFDGFAPLLNKTHPALIKDGVMSPGGTTAAGYGALEENGVRNAMMEAIKRAFEKTK